MRYVHPVSVHEAFLASGTYRYEREGEPTGCVEYWTMHTQPDGAWLMRADRDCRAVNGRSLMAEVWRAPQDEGGAVERFDLYAYGQPSDKGRQVKVTFARDNDAVLIGRTVNRTERYDAEWPYAGEQLQVRGLLFFGARIRAGVSQSPLTLLTHADWTDSESDFLPQALTLSVKAEGRAQVQIDGKPHEGEVFIVGTPALEDVFGQWAGRYIVNAQDIILRAEFDNGLTVNLEHYSHVLAAGDKRA